MIRTLEKYDAATQVMLFMLHHHLLDIATDFVT